MDRKYKIQTQIDQEVINLQNGATKIAFNFFEANKNDPIAHPNYSVFFKALKTNTTLTSLVFIDADLQVDDVTKLFTSLGDNVKELMITFFNSKNQSQWVNAMVLFLATSNIEILDLDEVNLSDTSLEIILNCLRHNKIKLRVLNLYRKHFPFPDSLIPLLNDVVINNNTLHNISVNNEHVQISDALTVNYLYPHRLFKNILPDEVEHKIYKILKSMIIF